MLGDIGQPQLVRAGSGEHSPDEILMGWRAGLFGLAGLLLAEHRPPAHLRTDLPHGPIRHIMASISGLIGEEPIAELGVCLLYTSPSPRDQRGSRMPSSA